MDLRFCCIWVSIPFELQGKPFNILVQEGQQVTAATQVAEVDLAELAASNKATPPPPTDMLVWLWYSPIWNKLSQKP